MYHLKHRLGESYFYLSYLLFILFDSTLFSKASFSIALFASASFSAAIFAANATGSVANEQSYLRKNFFKVTNSISPPSTASFNAVTASAPTPLTATSENDFIFFINGQYLSLIHI